MGGAAHQLAAQEEAPEPATETAESDEAPNKEVAAAKERYDVVYPKYTDTFLSMSDADLKNKFFREIMDKVSKGDDRIQELEQSGTPGEIVAAYDDQVALIEEFLAMTETSDALGAQRSSVVAELDRLEKDGASRHEDTADRYHALRKVLAEIDSSSIKDGDFEKAKAELSDLSGRCSLLQTDIDRLFELQWRSAQEAFRVASDSMDTELLAVRRLRPDFAEARLLHQRIKKRYRVVPLLEAAQADERDGKYAQAISLYETILELDPMTEEVQGKVQALEASASEQIIKESLREALDFITSGDPQKALVPARRALKLSLAHGFDPVSAQLLIERAEKEVKSNSVRAITKEIQVALEKKDWGEVIRAADELLAIQPGNHLATSAREKAIDQRRQIISMTEVIAQATFQLEKASRDMSRPLVEYVLDLLGDSRVKYPDAVDESFIAIEKRAEEVLAGFDNEIEVEFVSNRRAEIELRGYGKLGKFSRLTVPLKPGIYEARCTQKGHRDRLIKIEIRPGETPEPIVLEAGKKF